jgi:hypothetical protein
MVIKRHKTTGRTTIEGMGWLRYANKKKIGRKNMRFFFTREDSVLRTASTVRIVVKEKKKA